jgi:hypothetical protein
MLAAEHFRFGGGIMILRTTEKEGEEKGEGRGGREAGLKEESLLVVFF